MSGQGHKRNMSGLFRRTRVSQLALLLQTTDLKCGFVSVDLGHLAIKKDQVVAFTLNSLDRLGPVDRDVDSAFESFEHRHSNLSVDRMIFGQEDERSGCGLFELPNFWVVAATRSPCIRIELLLVVG